MAIVLVGSAQYFSTDTNGFTSGNVDTTGANFVIGAHLTTAGTYTLNDSKSNGYTSITPALGYFDTRQLQFFYAYNAAAGTGHNWTTNGTGNASALCLAWYSGVLTTDPIDVSTAGVWVENTTVQPGTMTPSVDGCLVIQGLWKAAATAVSISGGFTKDQDITNTDFGHFFGAMAHLIQTTAAASNPTWTITGTEHLVAQQIAFKPGAGGDPPPPTSLELVSTLKHRGATRPAPFRPGVAR